MEVQGDTAISLYRERSVVRRRVLAFRRGALGRAARAHIVERTSDGVNCYMSVVQKRVVWNPVVQGLMVRGRCIWQSVYTEPSSRGATCQNVVVQILNTEKNIARKAVRVLVLGVTIAYVL